MMIKKTILQLHDTLSRMPKTHCFCAFSGGADSTALLLMLRDVCRELAIPLTALHAEHGLRERAVDDAQWAENFCAELDIPIIVGHLDVPAHRDIGESMEAAARRCRYAFFEEATSNTENALVVMAHHADDAAENLLIRLLRGGNLTSLLSPKIFSQIGKLHIYRPFIELRRQEILDFLETNGIAWREDETNALPCCGRNILRLNVLPTLYETFPHGEKGLQRSLQALRMDADFLESAADQCFENCYQSETRALSSAEFCQRHPALRQRVLRRYLDVCGSAQTPTVSVMERLSQLLESQSDEPRRIPLSDTEHLAITKSSITWFDTQIPAPLTFQLTRDTAFTFGRWRFTFEFLDSLQNEPYAERSDTVFYFDADVAGAPLTLRMATAEDLFTAFGTSQEKSLTALAEKAGFIAEERRTLPVLVTDNRLLLLAAGIRRSAHYIVTDKTNRFLKITVTRG